MTKTFYHVSGNPLKIGSREGEVKNKTVWFGTGHKGWKGGIVGRERVDIGSRTLFDTPAAAVSDYIEMAQRNIEGYENSLNTWRCRLAEAEALAADCRATEVTDELNAVLNGA